MVMITVDVVASFDHYKFLCRCFELPVIIFDGVHTTQFVEGSYLHLNWNVYFQRHLDLRVWWGSQSNDTFQSRVIFGTFQ